jgi:hypothetical protein
LLSTYKAERREPPHEAPQTIAIGSQRVGQLFDRCFRPCEFVQHAKLCRGRDDARLTIGIHHAHHTLEIAMLVPELAPGPGVGSLGLCQVAAP